MHDRTVERPDETNDTLILTLTSPSVFLIQICTLLKCKTTSLHTCGSSVDTASTTFEMFSLSGTFGTQYVFPEVLLSEVKLAPGEFQVTIFA